MPSVRSAMAMFRFGRLALFLLLSLRSVRELKSNAQTPPRRKEIARVLSLAQSSLFRIVLEWARSPTTISSVALSDVLMPDSFRIGSLFNGESTTPQNAIDSLFDFRREEESPAEQFASWLPYSAYI